MNLCFGIYRRRANNSVPELGDFAALAQENSVAHRPTSPVSVCPVGEPDSNVAQKKPVSVAIVAAQFAAYHIDRCEAVARRFQGRGKVLAVEVATTSKVYAWAPSGEVAGATKITLFPGQSYNDNSAWARFVALFRCVRSCDLVAMGIPYSDPTAILLSWALRLVGVRVIVLSESKFDDGPRSVRFELFKSLVLSCYHAAIVGGARQIAYFRFLGFRRRIVLPGYDGVSVDRLRAQGGVLAPAGAAFEERPFIFVGRFVGKKNLLTLIDGYARYVGTAGAAAHKLVLVGSGDLEDAIRQRIAALNIADMVIFPGFLSAEEVSRMLAGSLALVLVSGEEQWGLVVNEALAFGLPAIVSTEVGSRDALVRNLVNGYVVEPGSADGIAASMRAMTASREAWEAMVAASHARAWMGDTDRLADAVELLLAPTNGPARARCDQFLDAMNR